jgi:ubiquitin C-terminal hydrolase
MAPARPAARQTAAQNVANGIKKSYNTYLHRRNRRPRDLQNVSNTCYRNGALQALLHLPKFVSWM